MCVRYSFPDAFAADLHVDLAEVWRGLQEPSGRDLLEEFFQLHQTEELRALAKQTAGVQLSDTMGKGQIVKYLLDVPRGTTRRLAFPRASIKPVAGVATGKAKKKGR